MECGRGSWGPDPGRARRSIRLGGCHSAGGCPPLVRQPRRHHRLQECRPRPVGPCRRPYGLRVLNKRITFSAVDNHMPRLTLLGVTPGEMGEAARQVACGKAPATPRPLRRTLRRAATGRRWRRRAGPRARSPKPLPSIGVVSSGEEFRQHRHEHLGRHDVLLAFQDMVLPVRQGVRKLPADVNRPRGARPANEDEGLDASGHHSLVPAYGYSPKAHPVGS
jgi:hypothetical protein